MQPESLKYVLQSSMTVWQRKLALEVPGPRHSLAAVAGLSGKLDTSALSETTVDEIQKRLTTAYSRKNLSELTRRDLRQGCQVWFLGENPPGRDRPLATAVVKEVADRKLRAAFMALIDAYLDGFDEDDPHLVWLGEQLDMLARHWSWRDHDLWPERLARYPLFDPKRAVEKVSNDVMRAGADHRAILDDIGLNGSGRDRSGFEEAIFRAVCRMVSGKLGAEARDHQNWLIGWAQVREHTMAFPKAWPEFACALFLPWQKEAPPNDHRNRIMEAALQYAGDPRITPVRWKAVEERFAAAYATVVRWLTEASVKQFFDIVSEMLDGNDRTMWQARRKFWTAYLDAGHIEAAWVAFGNTGADYALHAARTSGNPSLKMFGRIVSGTGRSPQHCALLMKIGDLTIAEWSHNGSCRFWARGAANAPVLFRMGKYAGDYDARELMNSQDAIPHYSGWQARIALKIREHTGIFVR